MISETIVTSLNADGSVHIAPMGVRYEDDYFIIAPFKPSSTLSNLQRSRQAVINMTDDVCVFAGCLTNRYDWPTVAVSAINGRRLQSSLSHVEVEVVREDDDDVRPVLYCQEKNRQIHAPFMGFNRAQVAVLEAAVLVSRLHMLPEEKVNTEIAYLQHAVDKTAGENELQAWGWLMEHVRLFRKQQGSVL